ncbi:MAG: GDSL-type esterase/lipase family protein [Bacteroidota bacterium]
MKRKTNDRGISLFITLVCVQMSFGMNGFSSSEKAEVDTSFQNDYYQNKVMMHETVKVTPWNVVFLGNSIIERGMWSEWFPAVPVLNRGIGGDNVWGVYNRLEPVLKGEPAKIFLLIGINDLGRGIPVKMIASKYEQIIKKVIAESPDTRMVLQTVLPLNEENLAFDYLEGATPQIEALNRHIRAFAEQYKLSLVDLHKHFADDESQMPEGFVVDGLHLNAEGYREWLKLLQETGELITEKEY